MAVSFIPRAVFPTPHSLPRSYFLGHHAAGLSRMKAMLSSTDLIIECRDYRLPLTSRNPLFEQSLVGRPRLIVFTKRDLGSKNSPTDKKHEDIIRSWNNSSSVLFVNHKSRREVKSILKFAEEHAKKIMSLTGSRILIVGMPNVGKSSLLNALRMEGVHRGKAAMTGAQPGITRKITSGVKIIEPDPEQDKDGVYIIDTPGVFIPYVPNADSMLKLALVGSVKDTIIPPTTLADYLLFHININEPSIYSNYCHPTNDIIELLKAICYKTGRLQRGGSPDLEASALWMIQKWRQGNMGVFILDEISQESLQKSIMEEGHISASQGRKRNKEAQKERAKLRNSKIT